ncbi:MAG: demethoxyubiquinone hydroxylase family protein [Rickettsiales bacterium]|nr:demethoxyubiquinone hydroxylase family protein [Rickettsiales bacterium]
MERMLRVDHAGEYGAKRIYAGQLAVLGKSKVGPMLKHMAEQEQVHLDTFDALMKQRKVRPTALMPLWHVGGFVLGAATALLGEKAAMACTVAVESVIDEHYAQQEAVLGDDEAALKSTIGTFRAEEREHHDMALENGAKSSPFYGILTHVVVYQTKLAIWLSTRV